MGFTGALEYVEHHRQGNNPEVTGSGCFIWGDAFFSSQRKHQKTHQLNELKKATQNLKGNWTEITEELGSLKGQIATLPAAL